AIPIESRSHGRFHLRSGRHVTGKLDLIQRSVVLHSQSVLVERTDANMCFISRVKQQFRWNQLQLSGPAGGRPGLLGFWRRTARVVALVAPAIQMTSGLQI